MNGALVWAIWSGLAAGFSIVACVKLGLRRWMRRPPPGVARPPVLLVRPVELPTPEEAANLALPLPPGVEQLVLCPKPPTFAHQGRWVRSDPTTLNRKVGHLLRAMKERHPEQCFVSADADVAVSAPLLDALCAPVADRSFDTIQRPSCLFGNGPALVTAPPLIERANTAGGKLLRALWQITHHSFEVQDVMRAGAATVCGKAVAWGPRALALLPSLVDAWGEDLELARRLHLEGGRVALARVPAVVTVSENLSLRATHARITRWMHVLKRHRPSLFPFVVVLFACTPILAVPAWLTGVSAPWCALVAARTLLAFCLGARGIQLVAWFGAELLMVAAVISALFQRQVFWRGRRLQVRASP